MLPSITITYVATGTHDFTKVKNSEVKCSNIIRRLLRKRCNLIAFCKAGKQGFRFHITFLLTCSFAFKNDDQETDYISSYLLIKLKLS
jgi:hypothetical protein